MRMVIRLCAGAAALALLGVLGLIVGAAGGTLRVPSAIATRPPGSPVGVVQRYLAALAAHRADGVCVTFSPPLRTYLGQWDPGRDCRSRVRNSHWSEASPSEVGPIRIVRLRRVAIDPYGNLAVGFDVWFDDPCIGDLGPIPGCRPGYGVRADVVYLRRIDRRWLIVKPGRIFGDTDSVAAPPSYDPATSPGDRSMVRRLARLPRPFAPCPPADVALAGHSRSLTSDDGRRNVPLAAAPWLHIGHVDVARVGRQFCVALSLGGRPRRDSSYALEIDQASDGGGLSDLFEVDIDAAGSVHADLTESSAGRSRVTSRCRTGYGLNGDAVEMIVTAGSIAPGRAVTVDATSASLQPGEPLLRHPLSANDTVPEFPGVRIGPNRHPLASCAAGRASP